MTVAVAGRPDEDRRVRLPMLLLLVLGAAAWVVTVYWARSMGNGPGPMDLDVGSFIVVWAAMTAAMMFPSVSNLQESAATWRARCSATVEFAGAYLLAWVPVGGLLYVVSLGTDSLARHHPTGATGLAVALFAVCALYQASSWKWRALQSCATPVAPAGAGNALGSGLRYGTRCVSTSWAAMALLLALGFMHVVAMVIIAASLFVERRAQRREVAVLLGLIAAACGVAVALKPSLAAGLSAPMTGMTMDKM